MTSNDTSNPPSNPNESNPGETPDMDNPKIYVLSSIILLTLLGNGYVFFSIVSRARKTAYSYNGKMTRMYYFMLHLSSADILTALLTLLSELIWTFTSPHFYGGNLVCKAVKFLQMIGPYLRFHSDSSCGPRLFRLPELLDETNFNLMGGSQKVRDTSSFSDVGYEKGVVPMCQ
ncbi:hypothetical protein TCAL_14821 [Tigriopus californicus]|uniref:G-protein coupled receptors family 1 profile domain-containing protein n=1 Tax=Tigriopus californicus TaxID=6832 RepID=A0A553PR05_TIGCA|nr:hypothetical protein TCAL_14821 [Tigriopus californicus]